MYAQGKNYFMSSSIFWNIVDLSSTSMVIAFVSADFAEASEEVGRNIASVAVFLLWVKLFYFLRIFHPTAAFIRMITEIVKDMTTFTFILILAIIAFANCFYIIDGGVSPGTNRVSGENLYLTLLNTYSTGLGDFATDEYTSSPHEVLLWVFFYLCTLLIQIVLLNLLIALMGDTFDKVQEIKEQAKLKEVCRIISENWHFLNQN
jgi:hypothetical protein